MDPNIWIPLTLAGLALLALWFFTWREERARLRNVKPGTFLDWHDD